ncbi:MAG: DUF4115 domain-containing protein, partial [Gammaproteobacteria bacterium]|nr:DUF4115 domain-containing protein [Gammaproteobacteria bacterium]
STETQLGDESRQSAIGPGERLQAARIQQGLSLEDVAHRMHLSLDILKAIEDNNFEEITAPIFVKGYLRAYARIVSLNEDEMILQYRDFYSEEDPPISSTSNILPELSAGDARIKWTTYFVILVIAVLLAAWWWNAEQNNEAPISLDSQSTEQRAAADDEVISSEIEAVSEELVATTDIAEAEPIQENTAETLPTQEDIAEAVSTQEDTIEPAVVEPVALPESPAPEPVVAESVAVETESRASEAEVTETTAAARTGPVLLAPTGSDKLQLVVTADTWTDVKDANSYQLVYDLLRAGDSVELTGEAPFSVFLGNGHGVEIKINGEAVDVSRRIRDDNTARLKVGS